MEIINFNEEEKEFYKAIISYIGLITLFSGFALLLPLVLLIAFPNEIYLIPSFLIPSSLSVFMGYILWYFFGTNNNPTFDIRHTSVIVTFGWVMALFFGSLPFFLANEMSFLNSVFEAVSGWTTTGLTMVVNENSFPKLLLFWRSLMQFIGGAGLAILMLTAIVGSTDIRSGVFVSEGREERLLPSVASTTKLIMKIYLSYVVVGCVLYLLAGMGWFDAINHSMCAFSTGGFSTKDSSIGAFSIQVKILTLFFMFMGSMNFALHYTLLKGKLKELFLDIEPRFFFKVLIFSLPLVFISIFQLNGDLRYSFIHSIFQVISALTTTGYMTEGANVFLSWGGLTLLVFTSLMLIGASTGSTGGGLKLLRVAIIVKSVFWDLKKKILPKRAVIDTSIRHIGEKILIEKENMWGIVTFTTIFLLYYFFGVILFLLHGVGVSESLFEMASAVGTVGLTVGVTGPSMPNILKVIEIFGMWLGRLEFWTIFIGFLSVFRDLRR